MNDNFGSVEEFYSKFYSRMIGKDSSGLLSHLWKYPHKLMEKPYKTNEGSTILEVGAGEGEHLGFVIGNFTLYVAQDIDASRLKRFENLGNQKVVTQPGDATQLEFSKETFDRVIATCLLAHLKSPELALAEWRRVLKKGGGLTVYIPCDPGISLRIFRTLFTKPKARKLGYRGYDLFIAREHTNSAQNLVVFLKNVFKDDRIKLRYFPFSIRSWGLNLFIIAEITKSNH
jgi:phosphatidylethanolamine/phosphatidyl-N-methylethanolamine N-methyltransferase